MTENDDDGPHRPVRLDNAATPEDRERGERECDQRIDVDALRAELERLFPEPPGGWPAKPPDYPDTSDRHAVSAFIRKQLMRRRVDNFCELCGTQCGVLPPERAAADIAKMRDMIDYVLSEDPDASIYVRRARDHDFMLHVECEKSEVAEKISRSPECNRGIWFAARAR